MNFRDRDGSPFAIVASEMTPHVRLTLDFLYAKNGSTRVLSPSLAREVARELEKAAKEIEEREGFT